jgi:membrane complex biogenesis BtpA family protein
MTRFTPDGTVLAMVQPHPLPGSYRHHGESMSSIVDATLAEIGDVMACNFDGIILQNMNDMPVKQVAAPEAVAAMTRLATEIRRNYPSLLVGILLNWDGVGALAVAEAAEAAFVRVEHLFTGVEVTSAGLLEGQCVDICRLRKSLGSDIPVYADVYEVHGVPLGAKPVRDAAWEAVNEGFADGLFLGGPSIEASIQMVAETRPRIPGVPILLGGGASGDNIRKAMDHFDGVSVATWIKDGDMKNPINFEKARMFVSEAKAAQLSQTA